MNILDYQVVLLLTLVITNNTLLLLLYLGCTSSQRSIPFGYLLHSLVQGHMGPLPCFLESSYMKKLLQKGTRHYEIPE